jgi:hypothetical protein
MKSSLHLNLINVFPKTKPTNSKFSGNFKSPETWKFFMSKSRYADSKLLKFIIAGVRILFFEILKMGLD